jgi:hypothetical protein
MSHGRSPAAPRGEATPPTPEEGDGLLTRLKSHLREWPRRYVEMRVDAVDE